MIAEPPVKVGANHVTVTEFGPGAVPTIVGAAGGPSGMTEPPEVAGPCPAMLTATTEIV